MEESRRQIWLRRLGHCALALWAVVALVVIATLMATHTYALPHPSSVDPAISKALLANATSRERGQWRMVHVLYSRCRCSRRILDHLFTRGALGDTPERVVLVGEHAEFERRAREAGFEVDVLTPEQLAARWALVAAPALLIAAPDGSVAYLGGYTDRKQGLAMRDLELLETARTGARAEELPLFGCAVSQALRDRLDPLGLKSTFWEKLDVQ